MTKRITIGCDAELLRALLHEELNTTTERFVREHLDHCVTCREKLADLASAGIDRDEISAFMTDDELDHESSVAIADGADRRFERERSAAVDAVLQHLTATDDPRHQRKLG